MAFQFKERLLLHLLLASETDGETGGLHAISQHASQSTAKVPVFKRQNIGRGKSRRQLRSDPKLKLAFFERYLKTGSGREFARRHV